MQLFLENTPVPLLPEQTITTQENSPLDDLRQKGDKSFSFAIPRTRELNTLLSGGLHPQSRQAPKQLTGRVMDGPFVAMQGDVNVRRATDKVVEMDMTVPPGGISSDFWNTSLRELAFPEYDLPTEEVIDPIYSVKTTDIGTNSLNGADTAFGLWYLKDFTTLIIKVNGQQVFSHRTFLGGVERDFQQETALNGLDSAMQLYNSQPVLANSELYAFDDEIVMIFPSAGDVSVQIFHQEPRSTAARTFYYNNRPKISHQSPATYLKNAAANTDISRIDYLIFPPVLAPKYYNGASDVYNGFVNYRFGGNILTNSYDARVSYPLSPAFRWVYVIDMLLQMQGWQREGDWSAVESLAFMPFVDMAFQHPGTVLPYNIYPSHLALASLMPDYTAREFFDEFVLQTGHLLVWNINSKRLSIKAMKDIVSSDPIHLPAVSYEYLEFTDQTIYAVSYQKVVKEELYDQYLENFLNVNQDTENKTVLARKAVPLLPLPKEFEQSAEFFRGYIQTRINRSLADTVETDRIPFMKEACRSVLFDLAEGEPITRMLFLSGQSAVFSDTYSLDLTQANSLTAIFLLPLLAAKTGRKIRISYFQKSAAVNAITHLQPFQYMGVRFLLLKKEVTLKNNSLPLVKLEMEVLES